MGNSNLFKKGEKSTALALTDIFYASEFAGDLTTPDGYKTLNDLATLLGVGGFTEGSVLFADSSGNPSEDNPNLSFDDTTDTLHTENFEMDGAVVPRLATQLDAITSIDLDQVQDISFQDGLIQACSFGAGTIQILDAVDPSNMNFVGDAINEFVTVPIDSYSADPFDPTKTVVNFSSGAQVMP